MILIKFKSHFTAHECRYSPRIGWCFGGSLLSAREATDAWVKGDDLWSCDHSDPTLRNLGDLDQRSAATIMSQSSQLPIFVWLTSEACFLHFQIVEETIWKKYFVTWKSHKIQISVLIIKFYWIPMLIHYAVCGCFCVTVAELSSLQYLLSGSWEEKFADPCFRYSKM